MAIPLIIGAVAGVAGIYKAGKAISDNNTASSVNEKAQRIAKSAETKLETSRERCQESLQNLGQKKADILDKNVKNFIDVFRTIKNVDFQRSEIEDITVNEFNDIILAEMEKSIDFINSVGLGAGSGSVAGALTAFGAYNGTMMFAAASTGTAISSLSGAAATNATLAWLGGGSLASGGLGVAGGTMALGALAAGPALLVAGWYMGSKAEKNLDDARSNIAKAQAYSADCEKATTLSNGIADIADYASNILSVLAKWSRRSLKKLVNMIDEKGLDFSKYDDHAREIVMKNIKLTQLIKLVVDTAILDKEGNLLGDASSNLKQISNDVTLLIENKN